MSELLSVCYDVPGDDFTRAGEASGAVKKQLKQLGINSDVIRRVAVAMYEGEINMVIHANGGTAQVKVYPECVKITLTDTGPGIKDIEKAFKEGFSTATDEVRELGFGAGMGLPNMKKYTDYIDVKTEIGRGTTVDMRVDIPK